MQARTHTRARTLVAAALAVAAALTFGAPRSAEACGGFFCFTQPIDQSAERILYIQQGGQITVHIQISYTGDDDKFSWILPLPSKPTLGVGSDSLFQVLEQGTAPRFQLNWQNKDNCYANQPCAFAAAGGGPASEDNGTKGGVEVLAEEKVGPYETVIIKGTGGAELVKWLTDNGYQQPASSAPLIDHYAKSDYVFLALKLQKDKGAGDLAPIVVTLDETSPCLPLRLTAIAAAEDMPVVAWVLADHRAIPKNFLHVQLNEATIDWLRPGNNYKSVVSKAVDQASGHAFTTELAKPTSKVPLTFANMKWDSAGLATITEPGKMLMTMLEIGLPRTAQLQQIIRKHIPKPAQFKDVSDQEFYGCIQCDGCTGGTCGDQKAAVALQPFDSKAMAADLETYVIAPLKAMQAAWDSMPYITRLYTLVSPPEMNKDPIFAFNAELPEVDNIHTAKATAICAAGKNQAHSVHLAFESGQDLVVEVPKESFDSCFGFGFGGGGPVGVGQGTGPVNAAGGQPAYKVEVLDEKGGPIEIDPRDADLVDAKLDSAEAGKPSLPADFLATLAKSSWDPTKPTTDGNKAAGTPTAAASGGCSATFAAGAPAAGAGLLLLALLLVALRRRRA